MINVEEYKKSLKHPDAEEVLDLYFFRRLGYAAAEAFSRTPITPDQVTAFSLVAGICSALTFSLGTHFDYVWGALLLAAANALDCADGQLARIQGGDTLLGRVWDGVADYITSIAVFLGIWIGVADASWGLVLAAAISSGLHAMVFDYYQSSYISMAEGKTNFLDREFDRYQQVVYRLQSGRREEVKGYLMRFYMTYLEVQIWLAGLLPDLKRPDERMIRFWSFLGPTTNRAVLILCALAGQVEFFLWAVAIGGNLWLLICLVMQRRS